MVKSATCSQMVAMRLDVRPLWHRHPLVILTTTPLSNAACSIARLAKLQLEMTTAASVALALLTEQNMNTQRGRVVHILGQCLSKQSELILAFPKIGMATMLPGKKNAVQLSAPDDFSWSAREDRQKH
jgi:hypothetical protein